MFEDSRVRLSDSTALITTNSQPHPTPLPPAVHPSTPLLTMFAPPSAPVKRARHEAFLSDERRARVIDMISVLDDWIALDEATAADINTQLRGSIHDRVNSTEDCLRLLRDLNVPQAVLSTMARKRSMALYELRRARLFSHVHETCPSVHENADLADYAVLTSEFLAMFKAFTMQIKGGQRSYEAVAIKLSKSRPEHVAMKTCIQCLMRVESSGSSTH